MLSDVQRETLAHNWQAVVQDVHAAAANAGRRGEEITIVGVSKYVDAEMTKALFDVGCSHLGEARPQQLLAKAETLAGAAITWHLIGQLQRNKAKRVVEVAAVIHSVDSLKLLATIAHHAAETGRKPRVLIEVNISGDENKHGFTPTSLRAGWPAIAATAAVPVVGLMAMSGLDSSVADAQRQFESVRNLRDELETEYGVSLPELSMGMSGDYQTAIQAGATMVRIGSRLFEGLHGAS